MYLSNTPAVPLTRKRKLARAMMLSGALATSVPVLWAVPSVAYAEKNESREFDIAAGELSSVLTRFASEAGLLLSVDGALLKGKTSSGLHGNYTVVEALDKLLSGQALSARFEGDNQVFIQSSAPVSTATLIPGSVLPAVTVKSAAGVEQKITDAPASISVITKAELDKKPYMTLLDAVREIEGVDVGETTDKTGQGSISIRGMGADYTLILIDGKRQNNIGDLYPNNFGGNQFNHIPPKEMIERIEIIRGPASTLYGADALGGVINIITKKIGDRWSGSITHSQTFETDSDFGNDRTTEVSLNGPLIPGKLGLGLRGSLYDRDASSPSFDPTTDPNGVVHDRSLGYGSGGRTVDNENTNLGLRLDYKIDDKQDLTLDYETSKQVYDNKPVSGSNPLGTTDSVGRLPRAGYALDQEFNREQFSIRHEGRWDFGNSDITLHHINTSNDGRTLPLTATERLQYEDMVANGATDAEIEAAFLPRPKRVLETRQTTLDVKFDSLVDKHLLVYGGQYINAEMEDGTFGMTGNGFSKGAVQPHKQWALFIEDNWEISDDFTLTGGVRYDDHEIFGGHTSPRLYANWEIDPMWTLKGGVSTGYKAPKASDLYAGITGFGGQGTRPFIGTPDLKPETSINSELAVYFEHPQGHNFNVTVFSNLFNNKIESGDGILHCDDTNAGSNCADLASEWHQLLGDGYEFSQLYNVDKAEINGVELAGRYQLSKPLSIRANYTYTDAKITSGANKGDPLAGTAKHMANATLDWQVNPKFNTYLTAEMRLERYRSAARGWPSGLEYPEYYEDYTILHLGAGYKINKTFTVNARINNLLDEDFTSYKTIFTDDGSGGYTPNYLDDYNVKAKARSFWLSINAQF
ncbi:TonB-dependent receptor domain-containing protein [Thiomicrorhabdus sp.]|uniref:TonB-dependent receptor domain-containing protein n=1 Tax=Thiomicrorhabdus sp. TaxID=2039724 RepID=UPI0029C7B5A8|nr:TonB-dependent receptor [Thiomicrorhabdus sp.]